MKTSASTMMFVLRSSGQRAMGSVSVQHERGASWKYLPSNRGGIRSITVLASRYRFADRTADQMFGNVFPP